MYENHTDGRRLIAELTDQELLEIIKGIAPRMNHAVKIIEQGEATKPSVIGILNKNYDPSAMKKKAESCFKMLDESFANYAMEAVLRGLEVTELVQLAYGRSAKLPVNNIASLILGD
jgi:hypothetical protein